MHQKGQIVPAPILTQKGKLMAVIDGVQVDVLSWVRGQVWLDLPKDSRADYFRRLGEVTANFHNNIDACSPPKGFTRAAWDREGLIGETPLWGRFWENPSLEPSHRDIILKAKGDIEARLKAVESTLDYGLIHADLVRENVLFDGN